MMEEIKARAELTKVVMDAIDQGFTIEDFKKLLDTRVKLQTMILRHPRKKKQEGIAINVNQ